MSNRSSTRSLYAFVFLFMGVISIFLYILFSPGGTSQLWDTLNCKLQGGFLIKYSVVGLRVCRITYEDAGKNCKSNKACLSEKCVIGNNGKIDEIYLPHIKNNYIEGQVMGRCSDSNAPQCFTGEITISDNRYVYFPQVCQ